MTRFKLECPPAVHTIQTSLTHWRDLCGALGKVQASSHLRLLIGVLCFIDSALDCATERIKLHGPVPQRLAEPPLAPLLLLAAMKGQSCLPKGVSEGE